MLQRRRDRFREPRQADFGLFVLLAKIDKIEALLDKVKDVEVQKQLSFDLLQIEKEIDVILSRERFVIADW